MSENKENFIGFSLLADQLQRKTVKKGFEFTLMVVGESGLGKSTLVNSLFLTDLYSNRKLPPVSERLTKTTDIEKTKLEIEENGVKLRLTIVDTPGFGDGLEGADAWQFLKRLQYKVNLVPVIAKADSLTKTELAAKKKRIMAEIAEHGIELYQFPDTDSDEDEDFKAENERLKSGIPFAVVGANTTLQVGNKTVRGRQYPWGIVDIEDTNHSDFMHLKRFLIQTHMQDLKDVTHDVHYENFRIACLQELKAAGIEQPADITKSTERLDETYEDPEKILLLQQKDEEIRRMQEMLNSMQQKISKS